jgi:5-methylcytosine-specific restriction endonuclease McrA
VANANFIKKNAPERATECAECGGPIEQLERGRPRRFCSDECKMRETNRRTRRARLPVRDQDPSERACAFCGAMFIPKRRDQIYCPSSAGNWCVQKAYQARKAAGEPLRQVEQQKTCEECGCEFTAFKSNARWCSQECRGRHGARVASRRRGPLPPKSDRYSDREIFVRDGWVCHICGEAVDPLVDRRRMDGATIDHIIPLVLGGADTPENVATAHNRCNRRKGQHIAALPRIGMTVELKE